MPTVDPVEIPNRSLFRHPEVCEIAKVQPFVLRTWEAEFPDLGVAKTAGGTRVYRRVDVERVLRLKHLLYVEGLTLAGARRKLSEEHPDESSDSGALNEVAELLGAEARDRILRVRRGLRELSVLLAKSPAARAEEPSEFELKEAPVRKASARRKK
jgi:DNA-binding transcriptional MerR regulator